MLVSIRKFENLHIVCWLLKDTCWVMDLHTPGMIMIFPTLFLAFYITYRFRGVKSELYHNLAVCAWIVANTIWMTGEFFYDDTLRLYATAFFVIGLCILAFYYLIIFPKLKENELTDLV